MRLGLYFYMLSSRAQLQVQSYFLEPSKAFLSVLGPIFVFPSRCSFPASQGNHVSFPTSVLSSTQVSVTSSLTALTGSRYLAAVCLFLCPSNHELLEVQRVFMWLSISSPLSLPRSSNELRMASTE